MTDVFADRRPHAPAAPGSPAALLAAGGPLAEAWGRRVELLRTGWPTPGLPDAPSLLRTPLLRPPYVVLLRGGRPVPAAEFCRLEEIALRSRPEPVVDAEAVTAAVAQGTAVKFNRLELWEPTVAEAAGQLGAACGRGVRVYAFWTPAGAAALPVHRDAAHVLVVQVSGRKRWQVHELPPVGASWSPGACADPGPTTARPLLASGDLLYLPHGVAHQAVAEDEPSFHLSFTLRSRTAGNLRRRVLDVLSARLDVEDSAELDDEGFRRTTEELCDTLRATADRLAEHLSGTRPARLS